MPPPSSPEFFAGGGGLYATGPDYLRVLQMLLREGSLDGARILASGTTMDAAEEQLRAVGIDRSHVVWGYVDPLDEG